MTELLLSHGYFLEDGIHLTPEGNREVARIALDYETGRQTAGSGPRVPLALVPVGLSFEIRKAFRGRNRSESPPTCAGT